MPPNPLEELLASWLDGRSPSDLDYAELQEIARKWVAAFDDGKPPPTRGLSSARKQLEKRRFVAFTDSFAGSSPLARAFVDLFLMARMRHRLLSYLSIQEGMDLDMRSPESAYVSRLLSELLGSIGKRSWLAPRFRFGPFRLVLQLDPLVHLRPLYLSFLLRSKGKRITAVIRHWHTFFFRLKILVLRLVFAVFRRFLASRLSEEGIRGVYQSAFFQGGFCFGILLLFPDSHRIPPSEWKEFIRRIGDYFIPKVCDFLRVVAPSSIEDHGIIKLLKIGFGVITWRLHSPFRKDRDPQEFILETLRLAYSWGTTYPLVDNVLDDSRTDPMLRRELVTCLHELFRTLKVPSTFRDPGAKEAVLRIGEVLSLVPENRRRQAGNLLLNLLEAHQRDSSRKLSDIHYSTDLEDSIWTDTVLKAALIRLATIEVCGIPITPHIFSKQIIAALINQLGDDLWDIYQDLDEDRCTPFTYFLRFPEARNPFSWFVCYALKLQGSLSARRYSALLIGIIETHRCLLEVVAQRGSDPLGAANLAMDELIKHDCALTSAHILTAPHLDPDAVLFSMEKAVMGRSKS